MICSDSARTDSSPRLRGDHLAGDAHVVAEVDVVPPEVELLGVRRRRRATMTCRSPVPSRRVAKPSLPPSRLRITRPATEDPATGARVGREVAGLRADLRQRVGPRERHRVRVDALLPQPVQLRRGVPGPAPAAASTDMRLGRRASGASGMCAVTSRRVLLACPCPAHPRSVPCRAGSSIAATAASGSLRRCPRRCRRAAGRRGTRSR